MHHVGRATHDLACCKTIKGELRIYKIFYDNPKDEF